MPSYWRNREFTVASTMAPINKVGPKQRQRRLSCQLLAALAVGSICWVSPVGASVLQDKDDLEAKRRHNDRKPYEQQVDVHGTFNTIGLQQPLMVEASSPALLMKTACRIEKDGYFGSTYGIPIDLQYGFAVETTPLGDVRQIIETINEMILDTILSKSFPTICGYQQTAMSSTSTVRSNVGHQRQQPALYSSPGKHMITPPNGYRFHSIERPAKGKTICVLVLCLCTDIHRGFPCPRPHLRFL